MSRIGKLPVVIPTGVTITVDQNVVNVTGPKGTLTTPILSHVTVEVEGSELRVSRTSDEKIARSQHGLTRALIANMVKGVTEGFEKKLELNGVGFRVSGGGQALTFQIGF